MNDKKIWDYLIAKIGNPFGVAGLMGNLYAESGLRANNLQNSYSRKLGLSDEEYTAAVDNGSYTNFVRDSAGYGLAQWTYHSRKRNLQEFAKDAGKSIGDLDMQLDFLVHELASYTTVMKTLVQARSVKEASDIVLTRYEKPADQSDAAKNRRAGYGQKYFDAYAGETEEPAKEECPLVYDPKKVIAIARAEVGYLEKETNDQLDDKTANAGDNNRTKYARDLDALGFYNGRKQGVAWCDMFYDWSMVQAYGLEAALALTFQPFGAGNCGAGCKYSRQYYKKNGRLFDDPQPGDQIFFYSKDKTSISHTGLVYAVDDTYVSTVEGNTSSASGVVANGGCVREKKYKRNYNRLAGFGRPNWGMEYEAPTGQTPAAPATPTAYKLGDRTLKNVSPDMKGDDVKELQAALNALGYDCGKADGVFGNNTEKGVRAFQKAAGIEVDGKFGPVSFKALKAMQEAETQPAVTFLVTIPGVDAATATYLLETYKGATATEEKA